VRPALASPRAQSVADLLRLNQDWSMFAPEPGRADGWFVFPGGMRDERQIDLFRWYHQGHEVPVSWEKPRLIHTLFKTNRWSDYFEELLAHTTDLAEEEQLDDAEVAELIEEYWTPLLDYLCRRWNQAHPPDRALESLTAVYMNEDTPEPGDPLEVQKVDVLSYRCASDQDVGGVEAWTDSGAVSSSLARFLSEAREDGAQRNADDDT
jgi:hypothetical protein